MDDTVEPITPYGLAFGPPVPCTLWEIDAAFQTIPDQALHQFAGLGTVLGTGFDMAFGRGDMRTRAVATTAFGPIALEIDRRGLLFPFDDPDILAAFFDWARSMNIEGPELEAVPSYRFAFMGNAIQEALAWLGPGGAPEVVAGLRVAEEAVNMLLRRRGVAPPTFPAEVMTPAIRALTPGETLREPVRIFIAYSHKDREFRDSLCGHMSPLQRRGKIDAWSDRMILPGEVWEDKIDEHLELADLILLLISSDFVSSEYCYAREMARALERHQQQDAIVIPILIRDTYYKDLPFAELQMLPEYATPVADWARADNAWVNVVEGIDRAIEALRRHTAD